jgi:hypothetical protein
MSFTPITISQRDPRWINENLGFDNTVTIGTDGCTLVCLTMLVNGFGFNETPSSMNRKLKDMGSGVGYLGSLIVWGGLTRAFPKVIFRRIIVCRDQPAPIDEVNTSLDAGQPLVIEIDQSPSEGLQNHWVVLYARQGNDYLMLDPWPRTPDSAPVTLGSRYGFGRDPSEFITAVAWYDASGIPAPAPTPAPIPTTGLYVRVLATVTAGLTLRSAPQISAAAVTVEPPGTLLHCTEPDNVALPKIGVSDRWLQVSDPAGLDGYVAAWYVEKAGGTNPDPAPVPVPASRPVTIPAVPTPASVPAPVLADLVVIVSQSIGTVGLRLRSQPDGNAATVTILSAGAELAVLEPANQAIQKIGQASQWLNVRDGAGNTGYVAAWYIQLKNAASIPAPSPASTSLTVIVSSQANAGLRMRDQPNLNGNILKILSPGTPLSVLEPAGPARAKIGISDQWLNVKDPGGTIGYVAAWYVLV